MVKHLNEVYSTQEFSRTPNSGAIMGRTNWGRKQGLSEEVKRTLGSDLIVPEFFRFAVECKHYADTPNYSTIIKGPDATLDHWLAETLFDAINLDLWPLLFFKTNRKGVHFAVPNTFNFDSEFTLNYRMFKISGLDTFDRNSAGLATQAESVLDVVDRENFFNSEDVQNLLKVLED